MFLKHFVIVFKKRHTRLFCSLFCTCSIHVTYCNQLGCGRCLNGFNMATGDAATAYQCKINRHSEITSFIKLTNGKKTSSVVAVKRLYPAKEGCEKFFL